MVKFFGSPNQPAPPGSIALATRHRVLWIGPSRDADLRFARQQAAAVAEIVDAATPLEATTDPPPGFLDRSPAVMLLASPTPAVWSLEDLIRLRIAWPLAPVVSVAAGLVDGRRRSGPPLGGVDEVPWHDLGGRLAWWLADRMAGRPGTLGLPATGRREERFLEGPKPGAIGVQPRVAVAARRAIDLESDCDLVVAAGGCVVHAGRGRPPLTVMADVILWDVGTPEDADLPWLRMLVAEQPARSVIVCESFPEAERATALVRAGAAAVLGRPGSAEALAGVFVSLAGGPGIGLGGSAPNP